MTQGFEPEAMEANVEGFVFRPKHINVYAGLMRFETPTCGVIHERLLGSIVKRPFLITS
jgi:hypothetical protein